MCTFLLRQTVRVLLIEPIPRENMNSKSRTYILSILNEISVRIPKQDLQGVSRTSKSTIIFTQTNIISTKFIFKPHV